MGMEMLQQIDPHSLESRPGILVVGSSDVGKRTIVSRLISLDTSVVSELSSEVPCYGWTINTKYYTADLCVWMAHLSEESSFSSVPLSKQLDALIMVFDLSNPSSFTTLQNWVSSIDIQKYEILLCIGNKADLLPGHSAHAEYRRRLQKRGESSSDPHPEYMNYGILDNEGSSLLGDEEEQSSEIRSLYLRWCCENNIEYIEACALNMDFDKCLSINGDLQGLERLYGALSAKMWPGMVLKSQTQKPALFQVEEDFTDDESDFDIEYEILSKGSAEPWDGIDESWVTLNDHLAAADSMEASANATSCIYDERGKIVDAAQSDSSSNSLVRGKEKLVAGIDEATSNALTERGPVEASIKEMSELEEGSIVLTSEESAANEKLCYGIDDLEQLMSEISHMRENLRLLPDFQRKEMAAKIAMKMANMFVDSSDEEACN